MHVWVVEHRDVGSREWYPLVLKFTEQSANDYVLRIKNVRLKARHRIRKYVPEN